METILLIYNDETFSQTLQQFFSAQGYVVKYVQDAELAEEYAVQQKPDIIILDALLQKMNGFELCTRLKNNPLLKATPIIMMSAIYISDDDLKTGIQLGTTLYPIRADRCVMKPFELTDLLKYVNYLLGKEREAASVPRILIVDDEKYIQELLQLSLENLQYQSVAVATGKACLAAVSEVVPDVILLDHKLPDISGLEVLKEIRKSHPEIAVIFMTAYGDEDVAMHAIEEHVDGYLRKPFPIKTLLSVLKQTLEHNRMERERQRLIAELRESNRAIMNHYELLERANRELRALDKLKSEFLANIGHELRTPLNSVIGFTELLLGGYSGDINLEQKRQLTMILTGANRLLRVLNDVIEVSLLNAGQIELKREHIPITAIITEVVREIHYHAEKKKLKISTEIEEALPPCYCSYEKVKLIMHNLVDNAVKFSASGEIMITARKTFNLAQYGFPEYRLQPGEATSPNAFHEPYLVVSIKDYGIGIKSENFAILFDEFRQVDGSLTRPYDGTGLGLAISKKLIELHGGHIWLESQVGVGTTFYFSLPLSQ